MRIKILITIVAIVLLAVVIKKENMTWRQSFMKTIYPVFQKMASLSGNKASVLINKNNSIPPVSFYQLQSTGINGEPVSFEQFKGKKIMIVNTASDCGYTGQLEELQQLYEEQQGQLVILGFPANDFKNQEKGKDEEIATFCKKNYGVNFPLMKKSSVVKGKDQHPVFHWLTNAATNGWNNTAPEWNFSKYLVNEKGILTGYFGPAVSPLGKDVMDNIK